MKSNIEYSYLVNLTLTLLAKLQRCVGPLSRVGEVNVTSYAKCSKVDTSSARHHQTADASQPSRINVEESSSQRAAHFSISLILMDFGCIAGIEYPC